MSRDPSGGGRTRSPSVVRPVALAALVVAAALNVPQFVGLELLITADPYEALRVKGGHTPAALVESHFDSTKRDVGVVVELRELAPDARYERPAGDGLPSTEDLIGLALASTVEDTGAPIAELDAADVATLEPYVVARGESGDLGDYAVALADDEPTTLTFVLTPTGRWVVDVRLLPVAAGGAG